jgi:hypothetical protein
VDTSSINFDVQEAQEVTILSNSEMDTILEQPPQGSPLASPSNSVDEEIFIRTQYHPRRGKPYTLVSLDRAVADCDVAVDPDSETIPTSHAWNNPWAPFSCRGDFEAAERITTLRMSDHDINSFLAPIGPNSGVPPTEEHRSGYQPAHLWHIGRSNITMRNANDYHAIMKRAREYIVKVSV